MNDTVRKLLNLADDYAQTVKHSGFYVAETKRQALHDELTRLFTPLNQCDGCMAGLPLRSGLHIDTDGKALMLCQKSRYQADELAQLQEQNRWLDAKLARQEAVMRQALEALKRMERYGNTFLYRRDEQNPHEQTCEAIKVLEDALK